MTLNKTPDPGNALFQELQVLEERNRELGRERQALYRKSMEAALDEKALPDAIAKLMLEGPVSDAQVEADWPLTITGVNWFDKIPCAIPPPGRVWVATHVEEDPEHEYLAIQVGNVAHGAECRLGADGVMNLVYSAHLPIYYCPALESFLEVGSPVRPLQDPDELSKLCGDEPVHMWYRTCWEDLTERAAQESENVVN